MKIGKIFLTLTLLVSWAVIYGQNNDLQYRADENESDSTDNAYKAPQRFRLGEVLDAGISRCDVKIANADKLLPLKMSARTYAIIRVKLDPARSISIHDFALIHNYKSFNCVAISPVPGDYNAERRIFPASDKNRIYDLLFALDVPDFNASITYRCTLHYMLPGTGMIDTDVKFKNFDRSAIQFSALKSSNDDTVQ